MRHLTIPALAALALTLALAGCATMQSGGKTVYTLKRHVNTWETVLAVPIDKAHKATVQGLGDLAIKPITSRVDRITGLVDGVLADGTDFEVRLEALGDEVTRIRLRCGMMGDRQRSAQLFRAIEERL